jgi:hypothetical protein
MAKRFTATEKWQDPWFRKLPPDFKALWFFLLEQCDHAGIWKVDFDAFKYFIGREFDKDVVFAKMNDGKDRIIELNCGSKWMIVDFVTFQYGDLNPENRAHASVISVLKKEGAYKGLTRGLQAPMDKDKDKELDKDKGGVGGFPTLEEVQEYCQERKNGVDPEKWFDFYSSKGWMIGKNRMKDWKAAVRTWEKSESKNMTKEDKDKRFLEAMAKERERDERVKEMCRA